MRPIRLEVEGFACFRDRQPPLEFSELSLFAIAGPTGAGKSSILDAMLYALYGQVPRLGKQGITEVISHGRDALSVCLDFEAQGARHRVTRRVKKRGRSLQTLATLAEVTAGLEKPVADGVRPVNEAIQKKLGLGYEDFIQTVILPQGDFARFLRAEPKGQREILQHLLRHEVFERMRAAAEESRRNLERELSSLDGRLAMCEHATSEALAERETALADAHLRLAAALSTKGVAEAEIQNLRRQRDLTKDVEQLRKQRTTVALEEPEVERARAELENARLAAAILPRIEAFQTAARRADDATRNRDDAANESSKASAARVRAATLLEGAIAASQKSDELAQQVRRLDEIAGDLTRRAALNARLLEAPKEIEKTNLVRQAAQKAEAAARTKAQAHEATLQAKRAAHDALPFDEAQYASLEAVRDGVAPGKSLLRERDESAVQVGASSRAEANATRQEKAAEVAYRTAADAAAGTAAASQAAQNALEDGRDRHRAAALRAHLHAGENCPVCLQEVSVLPPREVPPQLAKLEAACKAAERRAAESDEARLAAAETLATAKAQHIEATKTARAAVSKAAESAKALDETLARLAGSVAGLAAVAGPEILDWIEQSWAALQATKIQRDRHDAEIRKLEGELSAARLALADAKGAASQASERHDRIIEDQSRVQSELASVVARIEAVTRHSDPRAEREELDRQINQLRGGERKARETFTAEDLAATTAGERLKAADIALAEAAGQVANTRDSVTQALAGAGFPSVDVAAAAVRKPAQQKALHARVATFDEKRAGVAQRLAELEPQIAGREISAEALGSAEAECAAAVTRWREADQAVTRLDGEVVRLREEVGTRVQLMAERQTLLATLSVTGELATDLKGDRFQEYLLEAAFNSLVAGASVRMKTISNRYTLEWESGEFYVVDHDNAGERRRAETLSGGETFMASLCLALQLSDEVLRTSGGLQIDSLFIDEGFGTLDADSLSEVTDAIETLRHGGSRLIGVISHRPELTDRLPGCIRVNKGVGESEWVLERVG